MAKRWDDNRGYVDESPSANQDDINALKDLIEKQNKAFLDNQNANYVKANANGNAVVGGGVNQYGFTRPDQVLMTGVDGKLLDPYTQKMGESANAVKAYGNSMGSSIDPRASLSMGQSMSALRDKGNATGDMASIAAMRQQANNGTIRDLGKSDTAANTAMANAQSAMAMRGGLGNGAAERMGKNAANSAMMSRQGIIGQNRDQNLNLDLQNENIKNDMLKLSGGVEQNIGQYNASAYTNADNQKLGALKDAANTEQTINAANIGTQKTDLMQMNLGAFAKFQEDMKAYGATKQADAQAAAGSGGGGGICFMTTACVEVMGMKDDCWALTLARKFRDEYMSTDAKRAYELSSYYTECPVILEKLSVMKDREKILKSLFWKHIVPFCKEIENGDNEKARDLYWEMMKCARDKSGHSLAKSAENDDQ